MHVWQRDASAGVKRTLVVAQDDPRDGGLALVFTMQDAQRCALSLKPASGVAWDKMRRVSALPLMGLLGLLRVQNGADARGAALTADTFLVGVSGSERVGALYGDAQIHRVRSTAFFCINRTVWTEETMAQAALDPADYGRAPPPGGAADDACAPLRKYLGSGSFYFEQDGASNLTQRLMHAAGPLDHSADTHERQYDSQYAWNAHMIQPILTFRSRLDAAQRAALDDAAFFVRARHVPLTRQVLVIQGYVGIREIALSDVRARERCTLAVISRLSARKAGTRFNARGLDDEGNAANLVETETLLSHGDLRFSFVQIRGSVPLFWEQQGLQALNARIQVTRTGAAAQPAFERHMQQLIDEYGRVFALDLLGTRDAESALSAAYVKHVDTLLRAWGGSETTPDERPLRYHNFDFHSVAKATYGLDGAREELERLNNVQGQRQHNGYTLARARADTTPEVVTAQRGVLRINCFDCLDRTNIVEGFLSHTALRDWFRRVVHGADVPARIADDRALAQLRAAANLPGALWPAHGHLWAANGDGACAGERLTSALSQISTGTGSLNSDYMRSGVKKSFAGRLGDAAKSASRCVPRASRTDASMYMNNFQDRGKQEAIDLLLGWRMGQAPVQLYDPLYSRVERAMARHTPEYSAVRPLDVLLGTYNVNAQTPPADADLRPWLAHAATERPHIVALSFQEVVPLTAQQLLGSPAEPMRLWEAAALRALNAPDGAADATYMVLRHEVMFATTLLVLLRADMLPYVRTVEGSTKKTGFRGIGGNKGGVAVRLEAHDTSVCFVGAHLAAGTSHAMERNSDYAAIVRDVCFPRGRPLTAHDHIFWVGDMNYRLDSLGSEEVRALAEGIDSSAYVADSAAAHADGALAKLLAHDQLLRVVQGGQAFTGYMEAPIRFPPTYKYDLHSDAYDSSEKLRPPAWTDRILFRSTLAEPERTPIRVYVYGCADVRISDHRPVYALLAMDAFVIDELRRDDMYAEVLAAAKRAVGEDDAASDESDASEDAFPAGRVGARASTRALDSLVDLSVSNDARRAPPIPARRPRAQPTRSADPPCLPPPSDDMQQWWNEGDALRPQPDAGGGNPFAQAAAGSAVPRTESPSKKGIAPAVPTRPGSRAAPPPSGGEMQAPVRTGASPDSARRSGDAGDDAARGDARSAQDAAADDAEEASNRKTGGDPALRTQRLQPPPIPTRPT
ncbi:phosphoinositide 5-phosphatase [Malassezia sp. CBS 17886]|nr:phosphoinositide 5-phosphatase [Malassezia sp. CBS 17886]